MNASKSPRLEGLSPLQPAAAVRDAEERAAVAKPDSRPEAGGDVSRACSDVTFTVPTGRTLGVIGRNGSGKSTMLKLVAGSPSRRPGPSRSTDGSPR